MDVVPKRPRTTAAFVLIIVASLAMIFSGSLDGAAAWANIIALPVAILGVILTLRGTGDGQRGEHERDRDDSGRAASPAGSAPVVNQLGFGETQYNIAGNFNARERDERDGR